MTDETRLEHLITTAPTIERTRWQQLLRMVQIVSAVLAFVTFAGLAVIGVRQSALATCTNSNLGDRNGIQKAESLANRSFVNEFTKWTTSLDAVFSHPGDRELVGEFKAESVTLETVTAAYKVTLRTTSAYRAAHPLGKC